VATRSYWFCTVSYPGNFFDGFRSLVEEDTYVGSKMAKTCFEEIFLH
jgi:hypothetical protein